jgi:flagellin
VYAQAIRNASDGIGLANVAQGAMVELTGILTRHAELAEQAANGMYSAAQRQALQTEATELTNEYNRIVDSTVFNGIKVFDSCEPTAHR